MHITGNFSLYTHTHFVDILDLLKICLFFFFFSLCECFEQPFESSFSKIFRSCICTPIRCIYQIHSTFWEEILLQRMIFYGSCKRKWMMIKLFPHIFFFFFCIYIFLFCFFKNFSFVCFLMKNIFLFCYIIL